MSDESDESDNDEFVTDDATGERMPVLEWEARENAAEMARDCAALVVKDLKFGHIADENERHRAFDAAIDEPEISNLLDDYFDLFIGTLLGYVRALLGVEPPTEGDE